VHSLTAEGGNANSDEFLETGAIVVVHVHSGYWDMNFLQARATAHEIDRGELDSPWTGIIKDSAHERVRSIAHLV